jgi:DNA (cytosine-5)-methyltransferase 1
MGFSGEHTNIIAKGKPASAGPRFKSIGNSWPVPVVRWIGERIFRELHKDDDL